MIASGRQALVLTGIFGVQLVLGPSVDGKDAVEDGVLRKRIKYLAEALVEARVENDWFRCRDESAGKNGATTNSHFYAIIDVNEDLGMVILDGGRRNGLKPGMRLVVLDKDSPVIAVRVIDSRVAISGALVESGVRVPKISDRVIVAPGLRN